MFDIEYKGGNTVVVSTKKVQVVVDPKQSVVGLKDIAVKDAVQLATEPRLAHRDPAYRLTIDGPGEYEVADVSVRGVAAGRHIDTPEVPPAATIYQLEVGGVRLAIIGNIAPTLSEDQLEAIGLVDIVIIPVGGSGYTLDATSAASLVRQLEPKAVIPVHYADSALSYEVPQDELSTFVTELSAPVEAAGAKYKVKSASSLPATLSVVELTRS